MTESFLVNIENRIDLALGKFWSRGIEKSECVNAASESATSSFWCLNIS